MPPRRLAEHVSRVYLCLELDSIFSAIKIKENNIRGEKAGRPGAEKRRGEERRERRGSAAKSGRKRDDQAQCSAVEHQIMVHKEDALEVQGQKKKKSCVVFGTTPCESRAKADLCL